MAEDSSAPGQLVVIVDDDKLILKLVSRVLRKGGYSVLTASDGAEAINLLGKNRPDLIISDVEMPNLDGLQLVEALRADPDLSRIPVIFLSSLSSTADISAGLELGGDDYVAKPFQPEELLARVKAKLARVPVPAHLLPSDIKTGLLSEARLRDEAEREFLRRQRGGAAATFASITVYELEATRTRLGSNVAEGALRELATRFTRLLSPLDLVGRSGDSIQVLMPETDERAAKQKLGFLTAETAARPLEVEGETLRLTPVIGFSGGADATDARDWIEQAAISREFAANQQDLQPVQWDDRIRAWARAQEVNKRASGRQRLIETLRLPLQLAITLIVGLLLPFAAYALLDSLGLDVTKYVYLAVVASLVLTAALLWMEGLLALRAPPAPAEPGEPYPPATAIIAAYLPNEAATIMETLEVFLSLDYPAGLQVILAYNTPTNLPVEEQVLSLSRKHANFLPLRVPGSESKAQNVNFALQKATGRFVGVFDADHWPQPGSFQRAWHWLSNGYDVVQGHCMVRNGQASWVARMVAVEFEAIYAVSHPGRAMMHDFGVFGGSNGFWRTDRLHQVRMRGSMLTEDIDSSMRVVSTSGRIANDPGLISAELGTTTFKALWNQRMRWAQGWFQVSLQHMISGMRSKRLNSRQKLGLVHLLLWREVYPWISLQILPLLAFWLTHDRPVGLVLIFLLTTIFTLSVGPGQALLAYLAAAPEIKKHRAWFLGYLLFASFAYTEVKNTIVRVAQVKHAMGERSWRVTPREVELDVETAESTQKLAA